MTDLDAHRDAVDRALVEAGTTWQEWPDAAAEVAMPDRARLSALLLLLASPHHRFEVPGGARLEYDEAADVIDRLRRRRLPWDADSARLALDIVSDLGGFDDRRVTVALRGAEQVCASGGANSALMDALDRCARWLDEQPVHVWAVPETQQLARQVRAAATPPDLLDLSLIRDGDAWAERAREHARWLPAEEVAPLVRALGSLGSRKPSQRWEREIAAALTSPAALVLLARWLAEAADTDVVPPDETTALSFSGGMLFADGNDDLVRAAVLATAVLEDADWVPRILGVLARRGAATSGKPGMTAALALKVAGAAVDTLIARGDREVLLELLEDLSRRDLVKRIGSAIREEGRAAERDRELRRVKSAAVRRKADPRPIAVRAGVDALIRRLVAPELRLAGFKGSGRTFKRHHPDRLDIVALLSSSGRIGLEYGTRFDAVHTPGEEWDVGREEARSWHLDVRVGETWEATAESLERLGAHLTESVIPFLDSLGRLELLVAYVEHGAGAPRGSNDIERLTPEQLERLRRAAGEPAPE